MRVEKETAAGNAKASFFLFCLSRAHMQSGQQQRFRDLSAHCRPAPACSSKRASVLHHPSQVGFEEGRIKQAANGWEEGGRDFFFFFFSLALSQRRPRRFGQDVGSGWMSNEGKNTKTASSPHCLSLSISCHSLSSPTLR